MTPDDNSPIARANRLLSLAQLSLLRLNIAEAELYIQEAKAIIEASAYGKKSENGAK